MHNFCKMNGICLHMSFFCCIFAAAKCEINKRTMKKIFMMMFAAMMTITAMAQEKMMFTIQGPEETYNQIRVMNETSIPQFRCRVVLLDEADQIQSVYGIYEFKTIGDIDSQADINRVKRGTKVGIQLPEDFTTELSYSVEYKDYPFYDAIIIHLSDKATGFRSEF